MASLNALRGEAAWHVLASIARTLREASAYLPRSKPGLAIDCAAAANDLDRVRAGL